ncbi:SRPBCC family protein [Actinophytocola sp.]|uniref:SRPBCC family protein n=1 Tax=Actinophytocola sp. TaxID=1872138 RepID=UPI00389A793A
MSTDTDALTVTKSITVNAGRERAFAVFTEKFSTWWPKSHHIGKAELADAVIEPAAGGRWYERGTDGSECDWGVVLAYDPPERVVLSWHLQGDWSYDPDPAKASEVEVVFTEEADGRTRVVLTHRHLDRHDDQEAVRGGVDAPGGWGGILADYAAACG